MVEWGFFIFRISGELYSVQVKYNGPHGKRLWRFFIILVLHERINFVLHEGERECVFQFYPDAICNGVQNQQCPNFFNIFMIIDKNTGKHLIFNATHLFLTFSLFVLYITRVLNNNFLFGF